MGGRGVVRWRKAWLPDSGLNCSERLEGGADVEALRSVNGLFFFHFISESFYRNRSAAFASPTSLPRA